jgi:hypothetical protein
MTVFNGPVINGPSYPQIYQLQLEQANTLNMAKFMWELQKLEKNGIEIGKLVSQLQEGK